MSYDLFLTTDASRPLDADLVRSLRSRVQDADALAGCEVHFYVDDAESSPEDGDLLVVNLPADERVAERALAELKLVAKEYGLRLHDPQVGDDVDPNGEARLPEMF
ncbi:MAG: hypothetical protein H0V86_07960 [Chloroflexia bacterium]|nr:hypothetical protein [Chloroflexia bacterium]